jgi:hypothetical protein
MARRTLEEKNPGTCVARLASTFFRALSVFRGLDSSPDWVAGDASARISLADYAIMADAEQTKVSEAAYGELQCL